MKYLKKINKVIAYFLTITFIIPTMYSCTSNTDEISNTSISEKYQGATNEIINSVNLLNQTSFNGFAQRNINGIEITQEMIDQYSIAAGYDAGYVSLDFVEQVMIKHSDLINSGLENVLNEFNLTSFTKSKINDISQNGWISDLQNYPDYQNLNINEKEILSFVNTVAHNSIYLNTQDQARFWSSFTALMVGSIVGGILFGPVGMIAGGVIGMYVHSLAKP